MDISKLLSTVPGFSPKAILPMVTQNLANDIGFMPEHYRLIYLAKDNEIFFEIKLPSGKFQKFLFPDGENLVDAVKMQAANYVKDLDTTKVDAAVLIYDSKEAEPYKAQLYYRDDKDVKTKFEKTI